MGIFCNVVGFFMCVWKPLIISLILTGLALIYAYKMGTFNYFKPYKQYEVMNTGYNFNEPYFYLSMQSIKKQLNIK